MAILAFDCLTVALIALVFTATTPHIAWAYVDPSVMTYTIQALAGVAVALSAVLGVALRRTRKHLMRLLNIDENTGKDVEPDVHRVDPITRLVIDDPKTTNARQETAKSEMGTHGCGTGDETESPHASRPAPISAQGAHLPWRHRIALSLLVSAFSVLTVAFVAPLEMVAGNASSLFFGIRDIGGIMLAASCALTAAVALVLSALRGRAFGIALLALFGLGLCAYLQTLFLNIGMPVADGERVVWSDYTTMTVLSGGVWLIILGCCVAASLARKVPAKGIAAALSICLLIVQGIGVLSLFGTTHTAARVSTTEQGLFSVSDKDNVIVFLLDSYDTEQLNRLLVDHPDMLSEMTGFTYYPDSSGSMVPTHHAIPYLLTNQLPRNDETYSAYIARRYPDSTFIEGIAQAGYSVGLYSDALEYESLSEEEIRRTFLDSTINVRELNDISLDAMGAVRILWKCALYRDVPWLLKKHFWFYTDEVNNAMVSNDDDGSANALGKTLYQMDDARYYERLRTFGLSIEEPEPQPESGEEQTEYRGALRLIHLVGPHYPFNLDEEANFIGVDASTSDRQAVGTMRIVSEYLRLLKELGAYDRSTIIITADHGKWFLTGDPLQEAVSPIMLIKPATSSGSSENAANGSAGNTGDVDAPYAISPTPVSHMDLPATIYAALGLDPSPYGASIWKLEASGVSDTPEAPNASNTSDTPNAPNAQRTRLYYTTTSTTDAKAVDIVEYEITGNALDIENWRMTGNVWNVHE